MGPRVAIGSNCRIDRPGAVELGERSTIEHNVWLKLVDDSAKLSIGAWSFIGTGTEFDVMESVEVGEHTLIAPGCYITDHTHGIISGVRIDQQRCFASPVKIGSDVWIGTKVCVLRGVTIGDGAVIGAGSVVRKDVEPGSIVVGVPARLVGHRK